VRAAHRAAGALTRIPAPAAATAHRRDPERGAHRRTRRVVQSTARVSTKRGSAGRSPARRTSARRGRPQFDREEAA
jgi:hypothetical protein